jgi:hypothetical protein
MTFNRITAALAIIISTFLISCDQDIRIQKEQLGHYVSKEYLDSVKKDKNFKNNKIALYEIVMSADDSNLVFYEVSKSKRELKYIPVKKNLFVITGFYGSLVDAEMTFEGEIMTLRNTTTDQKTEFIKIKESDLSMSNEQRYVSYAMPYINNLVFTGTYVSNQDTVSFSELGEVRGLPNLNYYSMCHSKFCREFNKTNTVFLSNGKNEGNSFEFEFKGDSLFIYQLDFLKELNRVPSERTKTILAAKKIN